MHDRTKKGGQMTKRIVQWYIASYYAIVTLAIIYS